jgi:hypothetical protein
MGEPPTAATGRKSRQRWWDNLENTHWDSMGPYTKVGQSKLLRRLARVVPSTGTITSDHCAEHGGKRAPVMAFAESSGARDL